MTTPRPLSPHTILRSILVAAGIGAVIMSLIIFIDGPPTHRDESVYQTLSEWMKPGYFSTHDMRNYVIGILIFASAPAVVKTAAQSGLLRRCVKHRLLWCMMGLCAGVALISIMRVLFSKWELLAHLLATKNRGRQLAASVRMLPFIGLVWVGVFASLRTGVWPRLTFLLWNMFRKTGLSTYKMTPSMPGLCRDGIVIVMISILVWNPRFAYTYERLGSYGGEGNHQFHHVISFLGPIHEAMRGTGFLVGSGAQYGILMTLIPAALFSFTGVSFALFAAYAGVIALGYEILWYVFLLRCTRNRLLAVLGTILSIRLTHYRWFWPHEATIYPSTMPLRYGWDVIIWMAILMVAAHPSRRRVWILAVACATAVWYNVEIGGAVTVATFGALVWERHQRTFIRWLNIYVGVFVGWGMLISWITWMRAGVVPHWGSVFSAVGLFGRGFLDYPMVIIGEYYIVLSVYFVTYCCIYFSLVPKTQRFLVKFTLLYGLLTFVYYLGSNEPHHLMAVLHPALLLCILALSKWRSIKAWMGRVGSVERSLVITYFLIVGALFLWEPHLFFQDVGRRLKNRYGPLPRTYHHWDYPGAGIFVSDNDGTDVLSAVSAIKKYSVNASTALILSRYDTLLYVMSGKTSRVDMSYLEYEAVLKQQQQRIISSIQQNPPEYAFVYASAYSRMRTDTISMVWDAVKDRYGFVEHAGMVDVYVRLANAP